MMKLLSMLWLRLSPASPPPHHLFLTLAWYAQQWWLEEDQLSTCTPHQLESVLPSSLALTYFTFLQNHGMTTDTGIVSSGICLA